MVFVILKFPHCVIDFMWCIVFCFKKRFIVSNGKGVHGNFYVFGFECTFLYALDVLERRLWGSSHLSEISVHLICVYSV